MLWRKILIALVLLGFVFSAGAYYINSFHSDIHLYTDGSYDVKERIVVDFGSEQRHGIYREIPVRYKLKMTKKRVYIDVDKVTDDDGNEYQVKTSRKGDYLNVRIGSPNFTISGVQVYVIKYNVSNAMLYFDDYDELYWNVTGTEWPVEIIEASATVYLPSEMPTDEIRTTCYTGLYGSEYQDCRARVTDGTVEFEAAGPLGAMEGLSIGVSMPKGYIKKPGIWKALMFVFHQIWPLIFLPLGIIWLLFLYYRRGKDPVKLSIAPRYEPPEELTPAEAGTLVDERVDMRDLTSTIVDLAVRGYLKIVELEKTKLVFMKSTDYALVKLQEPHGLKSFEKKFFNGLFERGSIEDEDIQKVVERCPECEGKTMITVSSLKEEFYVELPIIRNSLYDTLVGAKYFPSRPDKVRSNYLVYGIILLIIAFPLFLIFMSVGFLFSLIPLGVLTIIIGQFMPRKTKDGAIKAVHIAGFEEFVRRVEKDRIERMAQDDPTVFERLLPYAMALGVADQWANAFKDIFKEAPKWYIGQPGAVFYPTMFVSNLGNAVSTAGTAMASRPRSSGAGGGGSSFGGGGFSGGGFGGGGGGAW